MTALFSLPLDEPSIMKSEVFLVSVEKSNDKASFFRFRFSEEIKDGEGDLIQQYIELKQFKVL